MGGETTGVKLRKQHSMPCQAPFEPPKIAELLSCVVPAPPVRTLSYGTLYFVRPLFAYLPLRFGPLYSCFVLSPPPKNTNPTLPPCHILLYAYLYLHKTFHVKHFVTTVSVCTILVAQSAKSQGTSEFPQTGVHFHRYGGEKGIQSRPALAPARARPCPGQGAPRRRRAPRPDSRSEFLGSFSLFRAGDQIRLEA